jgi:TonB family protein
MNRLNKKCYIASAAFHSLLLGIFLFGSAFLTHEEKVNNTVVLKAFDPNLVTDALESKGGNLNVAVAPSTPEPPPVAQPVPVTPPAPPPQPKPEPKHVEVPKPVDPPKVKPLTQKDLEPINKTKPVKDTPKVKPPKIVINPDELKTIKRTVSKQPVKDTAQADAKVREQAAKDAKRRADAFGQLVKNIDKNTTSRTPVAIFDGPGGGGPLSAAYKDLVASTYTSAWAPPADLSDDTATVIASITIASDGRVINGRITKRSGNAAMDRSIQNTLDNVTYIQPFPQGSTDRERTYSISFNLQAKRSFG